MMRNIAIIPARSGSQGIKDKNLMEIKGKTLLEIAVQEALNSELISRVIVSTDSQYYAELAQSYGAETPFLRPVHISGSEATALDVIRHTMTELGIDDDIKIAYLQPTSPFRIAADIDKAIMLLDNYDDVVSVVDVPHNMLPESLMVEKSDGSLSHYNNDKNHSYLRQKKAQNFVARNGPAIYASWSNFIKKEKPYSGRTGYFKMSKLRSLDIDDETDLRIARQIITLI